MGKQIF
jgi:hypothetical protein